MKYRSVILFTNRNCMVFDNVGRQVPEAQGAIGCYEVDAEKAQAVLDDAAEFYVARWGEWRHEVRKAEIEYLLGLRTRERDLADGDRMLRGSDG